MRTYDEWLERLESQASLIDTLSSRIDRRRSAGEHVELSLQTLKGEMRLYRSMLAEAPLDVLFDHASTSAASRHL